MRDRFCRSCARFFPSPACGFLPDLFPTVSAAPPHFKGCIRALVPEDENRLNRAMARHPKTPPMLTHDQVWTALDRLAERAGLSASGLAKKSGLDPTTFNKSKRVTPDGRERWPSTESVAKALAATNSGIDTFVHLIGDAALPGLAVPLIALEQAASSGHFDEGGMPSGKAWS